MSESNRARPPGTWTMLVSHGSLAQVFISLLEAELRSSSLTRRKYRVMPLSSSCSTIFVVMKLKDGFPSVTTMTDDWAPRREPCMKAVSADEKAWAMFVKPFLKGRSLTVVSMAARSYPRGEARIAGETDFPSGMMTPLPKSTMPTLTASAPQNSVLYRESSFTTNFLRMAKPASRMDPLPSIAMTKSCVATHISSPLQRCSLQPAFPYRKADCSVGHLPKPRIGLITWRNFSLK